MLHKTLAAFNFHVQGLSTALVLFSGTGTERNVAGNGTYSNLGSAAAGLR